MQNNNLSLFELVRALPNTKHLKIELKKPKNELLKFFVLFILILALFTVYALQWLATPQTKQVTVEAGIDIECINYEVINNQTICW